MTGTDASRPDDSAAMRAAMVASQLRPNNVTSPALLAAMGRVPREAFVPDERRDVAYTDRAVPLGGGRALNPPMTTALLLDVAEIGPDSRVLVVGAATGYALAIVRSITPTVTGVECDPALVAQATANVAVAQIIEGPLDVGAPAYAPYDAIVVDGAIEAVPAALVNQLAPGGRLATAVVEGGVTRLAVGRRGGNGFALSTFTDAEAVILPGFVRPREFVF